MAGEIEAHQGWRRAELLMALRLFHALTPEEAEIKLEMFEAELLRRAASEALQVGADGEMDPVLKPGRWVGEKRRQWWRMGVAQVADMLLNKVARLQRRESEYHQATGRSL